MQPSTSKKRGDGGSRGSLTGRLSSGHDDDSNSEDDTPAKRSRPTASNARGRPRIIGPIGGPLRGAQPWRGGRTLHVVRASPPPLRPVQQVYPTAGAAAVGAASPTVSAAAAATTSVVPVADNKMSDRRPPPSLPHGGRPTAAQPAANGPPPPPLQSQPVQQVVPAAGAAAPILAAARTALVPKTEPVERNETVNNGNESNGSEVMVRRGVSWDGSVPYPVENKIEFEFAVNRDELEYGKTVMGTRNFLGRVPFEVGVAVIKDRANADKVGLVAECNNGARNPWWEVVAKFEMRINNYALFTSTSIFHKTFTRARLAIPLPLEQVLQSGSPYLNEEGKMPIKIIVILLSVVGYERPFTYTIANEHRNLTNAVVNVEGTLLHVHSVMLGMHSGFFYQAYFGVEGEKNRKMLVIDNCSRADFAMLLEMIYAEDYDITDENVIPVLRLAKRFDIPGLVIKCIDYFRPHIGHVMTAARLLPAIALADELRIGELHDVCAEAIYTHNLSDAVRESEVYKNLSSLCQETLLVKREEVEETQ